MSQLPTIHWPVPKFFPALAPGGIHVWCVPLDDPRLGGSAADLILSTPELARAAAFHFETDRRRYVAAHLMLRGLLGRYLRVEAAQLAFTTGPLGKPALAGPAGTPALPFNLSHSGPLGLLAVSGGANVGVDIEQQWEMPDLVPLEERMFTAGELRRQQRLPPGPRLQGFYRRWTQLEAAGKCRGTGLELETAVRGPEQLEPADPAAGFTGCIASDVRPERVDYFQFTPGVLIAPAETTVPTDRRLPWLPHRQPALVRLSSA